MVQHASLPQQRHGVGTLDDLCGLIDREGLGSPAIIVVGEVLKALAALPLERGVRQVA